LSGFHHNLRSPLRDWAGQEWRVTARGSAKADPRGERAGPSNITRHDSRRTSPRIPTNLVTTRSTSFATGAAIGAALPACGTTAPAVAAPGAPTSAAIRSATPAGAFSTASTTRETGAAVPVARELAAAERRAVRPSRQVPQRRWHWRGSPAGGSPSWGSAPAYPPPPRREGCGVVRLCCPVAVEMYSLTFGPSIASTYFCHARGDRPGHQVRLSADGDREAGTARAGLRTCRSAKGAGLPIRASRRLLWSL
jgi:hypothetical protein